MCFKLLQCSGLSASMTWDLFIVTSVSQFCLQICNIYYPPSPLTYAGCWRYFFFGVPLAFFITSRLVFSHCSTRRSWRSCVCRQSRPAVVLVSIACPLPGRPFTSSTSSAVWEVWIGQTRTLTLVLLTPNALSPLYHWHIDTASKYM